MLTTSLRCDVSKAGCTTCWQHHSAVTCLKPDIRHADNSHSAVTCLKPDIRHADNSHSAVTCLKPDIRHADNSHSAVTCLKPDVRHADKSIPWSVTASQPCRADRGKALGKNTGSSQLTQQHWGKQSSMLSTTKQDFNHKNREGEIVRQVNDVLVKKSNLIKIHKPFTKNDPFTVHSVCSFYSYKCQRCPRPPLHPRNYIIFFF